MSIKINGEEYPECFFRNIFDGLCTEYQNTVLVTIIKKGNK